MNMTVLINNYELPVGHIKKETIISQSTNNELNVVGIRATITGDKVKELDILLGSTFTLRIPEEEIEFEAKARRCSSSYSGSSLTNRTKVHYSFEVVEIDKDLPEGHNIYARLGIAIGRNHINIMALEELLLEKGIITEEELNEKYTVVRNRETEDFANEMFTGKVKPDQEEVDSSNVPTVNEE